MKLDPIAMIDGLHQDMPFCVISFICDIFDIEVKSKYISNDVYFEKLVQTINEKEKETVSLPLRETSEYISHFLNPEYDYDWFLQEQNLALENIIDFFSEESKLEETTVIGHKTPENPQAINLLMAYKICKDNRYKMDTFTKKEEIFYFTDKILNDNIDGLRIYVSSRVREISDNSVIKITYSLLSDNTVKERKESTVKLSSESISSLSFSMMRDFKYLYSRVVPETRDEAIVFASEIYGLYIGYSTNPLLQFKHLKRKGVQQYVPVNDGNFTEMLTRKRQWFNTENNWFEELLETYNESKLKHFYSREGFTQKATVQVYKSMLIHSRNTSNFYFGIMPFLTSTTTSVYIEDIYEIAEDLLICTGVFNEKMIYTTVQELTEYFNKRLMLIDPSNGNLYPDNAINKLKNYCKEGIKIVSKRHIFTDLLNCICNLEKLKSLSMMNLNEALNSKHKDAVICVFDALEDLGFEMRGRSVNGIKYPLKSIDCVIKLDDEHLCFEYVSYSYFNFLRVLDENEEIKNLICSIPLIKFTKNKIVIDEYVINEPLIDCAYNLKSFLEFIFKEIDKSGACVREAIG